MPDFQHYEIWDTHTLLGVFRETDTIANYWLDLLFPNELRSDSEYIDLEKIPSGGRKLAPFVAPMAQGRAIYDDGATIARFKPAYIKASDPVSPLRALRSRPGAFLDPSSITPQARYDAVKADIAQYHRAAVERRWEWLAARAIIDAKVEIEGDDYARRLVDFGRAAGHTVILGPGARWGDTGVSIMGSLRTWVNLMHLAVFGGRPSRMTVGVDVWAVMETAMEEGGELHGLLKTDVRGSGIELRRDIVGTEEATFVGRLGTIDVYVYNDYYKVDGTVTRFMSPKDIVLTGPNVEGWRCFGMIVDLHAEFQALPIFPRNYVVNGDVAIEQILTQSAPLMVPVNPNATFKATVVA